MQNQNLNGFKEVWEASIDSLKKALGIVSKQELQAVSVGSGQATYNSIDKLENTAKYFMVGGLIIVGLIVYSKLK